MNAKNELEKRLVAMVSGNEPATEETIKAILKDYSIQREAEQEKQDLFNRIWQYLGAKRTDGLSQRSIKNYRYTLEMFAEQVHKPTQKITTDDIRKYINYLSERGLKETTLQTHINILRAFFGWLLEEEKIKKNPMLKIRSFRIDKKGARQALSYEEMERFRDACKSYKEKAMVEFLYSTGCRLSEAAGLRFDDLNFTERSVVVHGKGDKDRVVYFSVRASLMLQEYKAERKGGTGLFVSSKAPYLPMKQRGIQKAIHSISVRAGLEDRVHPHLLRHTFATHALNGGMDVTSIQQLLGHENITTTQIYAELSGDVVKHQYNQYVAR